MLSPLRLHLRQVAKRSFAIAKNQERVPSLCTIRTMSSSSLANGSGKANVFLDIVKDRRSHYALKKELTISKDRFQDIVKTSLEWVPSPFNAQGTRVVVLFDDHHTKFWDIVTEVLKAIVPPEAWAQTAQKMAFFQKGAATVLFFEDQELLQTVQKKYAMYAEKIPGWFTQSNAMTQFAIWTALDAEGLGGNLQHYNPIVDDKVAAEFNIPQHWKLNAQLVIGGRDGELRPKEFMPLEERYKVFGA